MPPKRGAAERGGSSKQPRGGRRDEDEELFGGTGGDSLGIQTGVTDITSQADEVDGWLDALDGLTKGKREAREAFLREDIHQPIRRGDVVALGRVLVADDCEQQRNGA